MSITDFGDKSKDEIIEYLIDEHNATERETAQLRQELAEAKETIEEFKRMIFASRSEKKHVGYDNPEQLTLMDLFNEAELAADPNAEEPTVETIVKGYIRKQEGEKKKKASYKPYMENYFLDGSIPISNNFTESCGARPYAVGRKNFYFHDTPAGAEASAIIYSLAQTAKLNNLSVFKYLQAVLLYMPDYVHEPEGIEELMPWSDKMKKLCAIDTKATIEDQNGNPKISR